jgi:Pyridoxamine 5'-phosphate oxidase
MAEYGVPQDPDGALPWEWARERLGRCRNFWLTTVDPASRPHSMPVWGVWADEPDGFFFSCARTALKARNLDTNPHVVVAIDDTVECVSVEGVAAALPSGPVADAHIAAYVAKYEPDPVKAAQMTDFLAANRMFSVTPTKAFGIIEREADFGPKATRWAWPTT